MSVDVILDDGFKYHFDGDDVTAKFVRIAPFSMKQLDKADPVRELYSHAMANMASALDDDGKAAVTEAAEELKEAKSSKPEKEDEKIEAENGKALMSMFRMYCDKGDVARMSQYMIVLLASGVAYIDGENDHKLNKSTINDLTPADFDKLVGEYIGNFINT